MSDLEAWGKNVGEEFRNSFTRRLKEGFFDLFMSGEHILDIGYKGYVEDAHPILPQAIGVDLDYPGYDGKRLPFQDQSQDAVFSSHTLEHIPDYRSAIADWFRVVKVSGHLIIIVPHQFLYERKLTLPSHFNTDHKRFYTPASLLAEIQEALDPFSYRVRLLEDNDYNFDYTIEPGIHAGGAYEILLVIQKIVRPAWADSVFETALTPPSPGRFARQVPLDSAPARAFRITTDDAPVNTILLTKLDHRGDFILATQAMQELRDSFPGARLTLACGPWNAPAALSLGVFDEVVPFEFFRENPGSGSAPESDLNSTFRSVFAGRSFDLAVDLRIDSDTRSLLREVNATRRAGFGTPRQFPFLDIALPVLNDTWIGRAEQRMLPSVQFIAMLGEHLGHEICLRRAAAFSHSRILIYGPYVPLTRGAYTLETRIEPLGREFELSYDICTTGADKQLVPLQVGSFKVGKSQKPAIHFSLDRDIEQFEFRLWSRGKKVEPFRFFGIYLRKSGETGGLHQTEAFTLLVALLRARMRRPYTEESIAAARRSSL